MTYETPTSLICPALGIGWQSGNNLSEDCRLIQGARQWERNWNAVPKDLADPEFNLMSIRISSGDSELRPPAIDSVDELEFFDIVPIKLFSRVIPAGSTATVFARDLHPGSVRCLDLGFEDVPFTVSGRTVTLDAPAVSPVRVYGRCVLTVFAKDWSLTSMDMSAEVAWWIEMEEVGGLS